VDLETLDEFTLDRLQELFRGHPGPSRVSFALIAADGTSGTLDSACRVRLDDAMVEAVKQLLGPDAVEVTGAGNGNGKPGTAALAGRKANASAATASEGATHRSHGR